MGYTFALTDEAIVWEFSGYFGFSRTDNLPYVSGQRRYWAVDVAMTRYEQLLLASLLSTLVTIICFYGLQVHRTPRRLHQRLNR